MKVLVVDEEIPSENQLRSVVRAIDDVELTSYQPKEGREALALVQQWRPDIVLIDAHSFEDKDMNGLETAKNMSHLTLPPAIILCSSNPHDALDAFDAHASGFLVKPLDKEKLSKAFEFASQPNQLQLKSLSTNVNTGKAQKEILSEEEQPQHIYAKTHRGIELIPINNIYCFKADNKYITVYHKCGEVLIDRTLKSLQDQLGDQFIRVHRNALVSKGAITALERKSNGSYFVRLGEIDMSFSVSRRHVPIMRKIIKTL